MNLLLIYSIGVIFTGLVVIFNLLKKSKCKEQSADLEFSIKKLSFMIIAVCMSWITEILLISKWAIRKIRS